MYIADCMRSPFTIIFIHGYTASPQADWYPEVSNKLGRQGIPFAIPTLPGGRHPHADVWIDTIHRVISTLSTPLVLVGHSLGTRAVLLYLEKHPIPVEHVVLIAAFNNSTENAKMDNGESFPDFFRHRIDLQKIKPLVKKFTVVHSTDDDSIDFKQGVEIANDLDAELTTYTDRKHFSDPSNADEILKILKKELNVP